MMSIDMLTRYPIIPAEPDEERVQRLMKRCDAPHDLVFLTLVRLQNEEVAMGTINYLKEKQYQKWYKPNLGIIKQLLVKKRYLEFCLQLWKGNNQMLKQVAFQMLPLLISHYPDHDELIDMLGETEFERMENRHAISEVLNHMAQTHLMRNENELCIACIDEAEKFMKQGPTMGYIKGLAYKDMGDLDNAEIYFREALDASQGRFTEPRSELGDLLLKRGGEDNIEEAISHLSLLTDDRENPKLEAIFFQLLFGLEKLKMYEEGLKYMTLLMKYKPNNTQAILETSRMANLCGEYSMAEVYSRELLRMDPASKDGNYQLALSLFHQGVYGKETQALLNTILENSAGHVKALQLKSRLDILDERWT